MPTAGSTYAAAKAAIYTALNARSGLDDVAVLPAPPINPEDLTGPTGSGKAIWIADAEGSYENVVMCGVNRLDLDELYTLTVVFQALPQAEQNDSQATTDQRVDEMLGEFLLELADDPTWGVTTFTQFETTRGGFRRFVGPIPGTDLRASRCEFDLEVRARISFTP